MSDEIPGLIGRRPSNPARPLLGLTILVVEDSRYASEAMRLLCLRSGARIRRADCLAAAHRHLRTYRPSVVIVDLGLPDGLGSELIEEIKSLRQSMPVVLGISGDPEMERLALAAGADGFLPKPVESLALFQQAILATLPPEERPHGPTLLQDAMINPDPIALRDDLNHMVEMLAGPRDLTELNYVAQFLSGLARSAHDDALEAAAIELGRTEAPSPAHMNRISAMVQRRIDSASAI